MTKDSSPPALPSATEVVAPNRINEALLTHLSSLYTIRRTAANVLPKTTIWVRDELKRLSRQMDKFKSHLSDDGTTYSIPSAHETAELLEIIRQYEEFDAEHMLNTLDRSLFTQIFCEFDSFTGALLTAIYTSKSDLLKSISREVTLAELIQFDNLEAVKLNMLEKEVETFRRDSYVEQFASLEKKFGLRTMRDFREWGEFVELSQRRNLLTHNGGRVSEQYLHVCDREGYRFEKRPAIGDVLEIGAKYFSRSIIVVSKVAFMLAHTLWRKVFPNETKQQAAAMNELIYSVLAQKRWVTAAEFSEFALTEQMRKDVPEDQLRIRIINAAIALKFSDRQPDAIRFLDSVDWSASYRDFKLAIAVLKDDFEEACSIMRSIGKIGEIVDEVAYHRWPLFYKFRESELFEAAYVDVYGKSFSQQVIKEADATRPQEGIVSDVQVVQKKGPKKPSAKLTPKKGGKAKKT